MNVDRDEPLEKRTFANQVAKGLAVLLLTAASAGRARAEEAAKPDPWDPVRVFVGEWEGVSEGQSGSGTVRRSYAFVLKDRYLHEKNTSTYPPQEKNKKGEVHEHWSFFSHDKARGLLVLRQFHQEGFVNTYAMSTSPDKPGRLVFESDGFENFSNSWKARETYDVVSKDEFVETFELAAPGASFEVYSRNRLKRVKK